MWFPFLPSLFSYLSTPAFPPSVTTHHSRWTPKEIAPPLFFFLCLFVSPSGVTPDSPFVVFFRFQSPRSLRIDCPQSLSGLFLPLSVAPARPRRTSGYTVGWSFSARGLRRFPFCCYRLPGYRRTPFPLPLSFPFPGFRPTFPFFLFPLVVSATSLTGLPNLVSAWFLLSGGSIPLHIQVFFNFI